MGDDSNKIAYEELMNAPDEVQSKIRDVCSIYDLPEIFNMLDFDEDGEVDIKEFCDGIVQLESGAPKGIFKIERLCRRVDSFLISEQNRLSNHVGSLDGVEAHAGTACSLKL